MSMLPLKFLFRLPAAPIAIVLLTVSLSGCSTDNLSVPPAAKVDGASISQVALEAAVPADNQAQRKAQLEAFISEQLLANAAVKDKMDVEGPVLAAIETSKRQILARAYLAKKVAALTPLNDADIKAYYDQHPELFAQRKVYRLQEIAVTVAADRISALNQQLNGMKTFGERAAWLKKNNIAFTTNVVVKGAEEWPADLLASLVQMKDGTAFDLANPKGFSSLQLTGIEDQPVSLQQAQGQIAKFLGNQRLGEFVALETKRLREAAKVEYFAPYNTK